MSGRVEGNQVIFYNSATRSERATVAGRHRKHGDQGAKPLDQFIAEDRNLVDQKSAAE